MLTFKNVNLRIRVMPDLFMIIYAEYTIYIEESLKYIKLVDCERNAWRFEFSHFHACNFYFFVLIYTNARRKQNKSEEKLS